MIGLLTFIAGILVLILIALVWMLHVNSTRANVELSADVDDAIQRLGRTIEHHADVSAVVEMVRQLDADPDALELIKSYPETVRAAAWLHYINTLGADLQMLQKYLSTTQRQSLNGDTYGYVAQAQKDVDAVRAKLDDAIKASGQGGLRPI